jgi:hypothetical protein
MELAKKSARVRFAARENRSDPERELARIRARSECSPFSSSPRRYPHCSSFLSACDVGRRNNRRATEMPFAALSSATNRGRVVSLSSRLIRTDRRLAMLVISAIYDAMTRTSRSSPRCQRKLIFPLTSRREIY